MKINAFGRDLDVRRKDDIWEVFDRGNEGKRRKARDITIPPKVREEELVAYLSDLLHEYASARHPEVVRID